MILHEILQIEGICFLVPPACTLHKSANV